MSKTNDWTILHELGYIYLFLAFNTDEDLSDDEWNVIGDKIRDWIEEDDPNDWKLKKIMDAVVDKYKKSDELVEQGIDPSKDAIFSIKEKLTTEQLKRVVKDMVEISKADGTVHELEKRCVQMLCGVWEADFGDEIWEHEGPGPGRAPYPFIILLREVELSPTKQGKILGLDGTVIPVFYKVDEHLFAEWISKELGIDVKEFYASDIAGYDEYSLGYPEQFLLLVTEDAFWITPELLGQLINDIKDLFANI